MSRVTGDPLPKCLIVLLKPKLTLAGADKWPLNHLNVSGLLYQPVSEHWSGFYEWLRDAHGDLLGVRYWPFPETEFITEVTRGLSYVRAVHRNT